MKWVSTVWETLLYVAILGSAWVLTARDLGTSLVRDVGGRPSSVLAIIAVLAIATVTVVVIGTKQAGPVAASEAELMIYNAPKHPIRRIATVSGVGAATATTLAVLIGAVGNAYPEAWVVAISAATAAVVFACAWPWVAGRLQRSGAETIPRWSLTAADARSEAWGSSVLLMDASAVRAAADLGKARAVVPARTRVEQLRADARELRHIDRARLGPKARGLTGTEPRRQRSIGAVVATRVVGSHWQSLAGFAIVPSAVALLGSARLTYVALVVTSMLIGAVLTPHLAEVASHHRARRAFAAGPAPAVRGVAAGVLAVGLASGLISSMVALGVTLARTHAPLASNPGMAAAVWCGTAATAITCAVLGGSEAAVAQARATIRYVNTPELGPIPVHELQRLSAGRVIPVIVALAVLNGFAAPAFAVALAGIGFGVWKLADEVQQSDYADTHIPKDSALA